MWFNFGVGFCGVISMDLVLCDGDENLSRSLRLEVLFDFICIKFKIFY